MSGDPHWLAGMAFLPVRLLLNQLAKFFTHFEGRKLEWFLSIYTLVFGILVALPPVSMASNSFTGTLFLMSETTWGLCYAFAGALHMYALHINGRAFWTPLVRALALAVNSQVFLALSLSLTPANAWGTGVITYAALFCACLLALWAAAKDCGDELKIWRQQRLRAGK